MSDLERVRKELTRLTERLRELHARKGTGSIAARRDRGAGPLRPIPHRHRPERGVS